MAPLWMCLLASLVMCQEYDPYRREAWTLLKVAASLPTVQEAVVVCGAAVSRSPMLE